MVVLPKYSVLMSTYIKDVPEYLDTAISSMLVQTHSPSDFVIVCDGPLTDALNEVLRKYQTNNPNLFQIIHLDRNGGLGPALSLGLNFCKFEFVARMDSDDIARNNRCEKLLSAMVSNNLDLIGGSIEEFDVTPGDMGSVRRLPLSHEAIVSYSKSRNPFNHMTVMFRKSKVFAAGGYLDFPYLEDYFLWVRMISSGSKCGNLEDIVVDVRTGNGMYRRRSNIRYLDSQRQFFKKLVDMGYISKAQALRTMTVRTLFTGLPTGVVKTAYLHFLRK